MASAMEIPGFSGLFVLIDNSFCSSIKIHCRQSRVFFLLLLSLVFWMIRIQLIAVIVQILFVAGSSVAAGFW